MNVIDTDNLSVMLTVKDAQTVTGLARSTLYELLQNGDIERKLVGRHVLVVTDSLLNFVKQLPSQ
jgi:excisionase family DNA binding protein